MQRRQVCKTVKDKLGSNYFSIYLLDAFLEKGVTDIWTKTSPRKWAGTNDNVEIKVCDFTNCCKVTLDDPERNDQERSAVDKFTDPNLLGTCFNTSLKGKLSATLSKDGSDGWYPDWAKIVLYQGRTFLCNYGTWLDDSAGYSTSMTTQCLGTDKFVSFA